MTMADNASVAVWLSENPAWTQWVADHDQLWEEALALREQGHTLPQAFAALGLWPEPEQQEIQTLDDLPKHLREKLMAQAKAEVLRGVVIKQLPQGAQQALLAQARAELKRKH